MHLIFVDCTALNLSQNPMWSCNVPVNAYKAIRPHIFKAL